MDISPNREVVGIILGLGTVNVSVYGIEVEQRMHSTGLLLWIGSYI